MELTKKGQTFQKDDYRYSRLSPSPHYQALIEMYSKMHSQGYTKQDENESETQQIKPEESFQGEQLLKFIGPIKRLTKSHGAKTILDYGAGKGAQYSDAVTVTDQESGVKFQGVREYWGVDVIDCYEPAFENLPPQKKYDGVISTDVLEHCYIADVPWIVEEMFAFAKKFVFANIACYPALARLPNGENAHITVRSPEWWHGLFEATANRFPQCDYQIACVSEDGLAVFQRTEYDETVTESTVFTA